MCSFKSGVPVYKSLTEVTLYTIKGEDSHTVIKEKYNIPDDFSRDGMRHCTAEYKPGANSSLCDPESNNWLDWEFVFDSERPNWWNEEHTKSAICQLRKAVLSEWENGNRHYAGNFHAPSYNQPFPEGFTCGGNFHAPSYNHPFPEGFTCGGYFHADSYNHPFPEGFTCGGYFYADSYNHPFPKGFTCGGYFYADSYNHPLPEGFTCGGNFHADSYNHPFPERLHVRRQLPCQRLSWNG